MIKIGNRVGLQLWASVPGASVAAESEKMVNKRIFITKIEQIYYLVQVIKWLSTDIRSDLVVAIIH